MRTRRSRLRDLVRRFTSNAAATRYDTQPRLRRDLDGDTVPMPCLPIQASGYRPTNAGVWTEPQPGPRARSNSNRVAL